MRNKPLIKRKKAVSLIELLVVIAVIAISITPLLNLFSKALNTVVTNQIMIRGILLAEGLMEEVIDDDFYSFKVFNDSNDPNVFDTEDATFTWFESGWHYRTQYRYINPNYNGDLASSGAEIPVDGRSNFLRIYLEVWHEEFPYKKVRLWAILTPTSRRFYAENIDSF